MAAWEECHAWNRDINPELGPQGFRRDWEVGIATLQLVALDSWDAGLRAGLGLRSGSETVQEGFVELPSDHASALPLHRLVGVGRAECWVADWASLAFARARALAAEPRRLVDR